jgi:glutamyl-tRNA synthetase
VAWLCARAAGGQLILRIEDLDSPRVVAGAEDGQLADLRWLGLDWDEGPDVGGPAGPYRQSERRALYDAAIDRLTAKGLTFPCDCSRRDIAQSASAPHVGDDGPPYPGICRARPSGVPWRRPAAVRLRVEPGDVIVHDALQPRYHEDVSTTVGDWVLRRGDGVPAYQLAVVVDDLAMGINEIVRGADLLPSTARQSQLAQHLGAPLPATLHIPMIVAADGTRLAKRARGVSLRDHRVHGRRPTTIVGALAQALGLAPHDTPTSPRNLLESFDRARLSRRPAIALPPWLLNL